MTRAVLTGRRNNVLSLSIRPSIHSFFRYRTCEHYILKTSEPNLLQVGTSGLWSKRWNDRQWGSGGQRSGSHNAEITFGDLKVLSFLILLFLHLCMFFWTVIHSCILESENLSLI